MLIPICLGMPRSASRLTWQITNALLPPEPEHWQGLLVSKEISKVTNQPASWPWRSHAYLPGIDPVIYTFRNPVEAYFSLRARGEGGEHDVLPMVLMQDKVIESLRADEKAHGRKVLWLKYEDLYGQEDKRVRLVSEFLGCGYSDEDLLKVAGSVNIEKNLARVNKISPQENFTSFADPVHGLQPGHVNAKTMGRPGAYLEMLDLPQKESQLLASLSSKLGY